SPAHPPAPPPFPTRRSSDLGVAIATPPSSIGPTLSPWRLCVEAHSPSSANGYSAWRDSGSSSSALAATSAATHEAAEPPSPEPRSEEHTSELQSRENLVCRL